LTFKPARNEERAARPQKHQAQDRIFACPQAQIETLSQLLGTRWVQADGDHGAASGNHVNSGHSDAVHLHHQVRYRDHRHH
jgi:hypothetical protein